MKKTITILASLLICVGLTAQINPSQTTNGILKKAINDKITMSGDEALSHLIVNPNPSTTANLKSSVPNETLIGTSTYDLQSNAAVHSSRIKMHNGGSISVGWTMSQQYSAAYSDRGTGYNFYDGSAWGTQPTDRLETTRVGWPSILICGNGAEASIAHNTDNSYVQMTYRTAYGTGLFYENTLSTQDSTGTYRYMIWNRSAIGGIDDNTIHMIALTAPLGNGGSMYNGLDGALLYYRSIDCGDSWDLQDVQLPGMDTSMFNAMSGDIYAIDAQGETVVIAYFDDWGDSFILKSTDNGDNWTKTTFLDFPVDKYTMDSGLDLDGDFEMDMVYSTDNNGAVILDANDQAHVFAGNMAYLDDDLGDGSSSWFPSINGLLYWNESMGPDVTPPTVHAGDTSLWYSDLMEVIAQAPDLNCDGLVAGVDSAGGYALYYNSRASMPNAGISANGDIYVSFSGYTENTDNGTQVFRHIYIIKSPDGGVTWSNPIDVTPHTVWNGAQECVFGSMEKVIDDKIRIIYQKDFEPGLAVRGDEDMIDINDIMYLEIDIAQAWEYCTISGCTDPLALNYDVTADCDNGCCTYPTNGISDNPNTINSIDIYPNPTTDIATLQITSKTTESIAISIVDLVGKVVYTDVRKINTGLNIERINVSALETGVYFINTTIGTKTISNKLVITK